MDVQLDMMTCNITDGLTEDAVSARLHQGKHSAQRVAFCFFWERMYLRAEGVQVFMLPCVQQVIP